MMPVHAPGLHNFFAQLALKAAELVSHQPFAGQARALVFGNVADGDLAQRDAIEEQPLITLPPPVGLSPESARTRGCVLDIVAFAMQSSSEQTSSLGQ
jgi:hypothetical protein